MGGPSPGLFKHQEVLDYTSEEMTAFETVGASAGEINACFDKWARVLRSVGVPADATFVAAALQRTGLVGTRRTRPHSDTIYNSDEVPASSGQRQRGIRGSAIATAQARHKRTTTLPPDRASTRVRSREVRASCLQKGQWVESRGSKGPEMKRPSEGC